MQRVTVLYPNKDGCLATIQVNSIDEFQATFAKHGAEILADIPNYTNIEPFVQFDEILE